MTGLICVVTEFHCTRFLPRVRCTFHQPIGAKHECPGAQNLVQSFSPTKLPQIYLLVHTNISYEHLFWCMLCALRQKDQCKSAGAKAACKIMMKLTPSHQAKKCCFLLLSFTKKIVKFVSDHLLLPSVTLNLVLNN